MKHRDRVIASLNREEPDRCPMQVSFTPEFADRLRADMAMNEKALNLRRAGDAAVRHPGAGARRGHHPAIDDRRGRWFDHRAHASRAARHAHGELLGDGAHDY